MAILCRTIVINNYKCKVCTVCCITPFWITCWTISCCYALVIKCQFDCLKHSFIKSSSFNLYLSRNFRITIHFFIGCTTDECIWQVSFKFNVTLCNSTCINNTCIIFTVPVERCNKACRRCIIYKILLKCCVKNCPLRCASRCAAFGAIPEAEAVDIYSIFTSGSFNLTKTIC